MDCGKAVRDEVVAMRLTVIKELSCSVARRCSSSDEELRIKVIFEAITNPPSLSLQSDSDFFTDC